MGPLRKSVGLKFDLGVEGGGHGGDSKGTTTATSMEGGVENRTQRRSFDERRYSGEHRHSGRLSSDFGNSGRRSSDYGRPFRSNGPKAARAGIRRMRRFVHQAQLRKHADPDDLEDPERLKKLFDIDQPSLFRDLLDDSAKKKWFEPFLVISEEEEEERLAAFGKGNRSAQLCRRDERKARNCYNKMDRRVRELIHMRPDHVVEVLGAMEEDVRASADRGTSIELSNGMCRMVAHGVAQFYGMHSWSEDVENGRRLTIFKPTKNTLVPHETLLEYILQQRRSCAAPCG